MLFLYIDSQQPVCSVSHIQACCHFSVAIFLALAQEDDDSILTFLMYLVVFVPEEQLSMSTTTDLFE